MPEEIKQIAIEDKMKDAYLSYSLSVIVSRALPDVRDGLKPVHRRILYAARELGLKPDKPHRKSARIVGEVLGKYHPHGDAAVYNAMVRMAQDFNQRYPLIDGHGNFGSIDGDSPAAMRYTEARLTPLAMELLQDIEQKTVNFLPNFDGSLEEPTVLPTRVPNLLINGSSGIAVGMSTEIPPHNLREVIDGLIYLLNNPEATHKKLNQIIKGPDFPTGGEIIGNEGIKRVYRTGNGRITIRGETTIENKSSRKKQIVIKSVPYQVNKAKLIEEIAGAVNKGKIGDITDIRDETDREGIRIVVELKTGSDPEIILNRLYKYTSLQASYRMTMLALVNNRPIVMNLKTLLQHFLDFRKEVVERRTAFQLENAKREVHLLEGLAAAVDQIDLLINIIRSSRDREEARSGLMAKLNLTEEQAEAVLKMQLQRLVNLEREKIKTDLEKTNEKIQKLKAILKDEEQLKQVIKEELQAIKEKYGDKRKTTIIQDAGEAEIEKEDLIKNEDAVITFSYRKYVKRTTSVEYARSAKNDIITHIWSGNTLDRLLLFTDSGNTYSLPVHDIPEHHGLATGDPINKLVKIPLKEKIIDAILLTEEAKKKFITIATACGLVKRTPGEEYLSSRSPIKAIKLRQGDRVVGVKLTSGHDRLLLATENGKTIHFAEDEVSATGRNTMGSIGIKLDEGDRVINLNITGEDHYVITLSPDFRGKRSHISEYTLQKRNGKGLKTLSSNNYRIQGVVTAPKDALLLVSTKKGNLYTPRIQEITQTQRAGNMYQQQHLNPDDQILDILVVPADAPVNSEVENKAEE